MPPLGARQLHIAGDLAGDPVGADAVRVHVPKHRGLHLAGVRASAHPGGADRVPVLAAELPPPERHARRVGLQRHLPRRRLDERLIGSVPVQHDDAFEAVIGDGAPNVDEEPHERARLDRDRAREVHDVVGVSVGHRGQHQQVLRRAPPGLERDRTRLLGVGLERKVMPVLFGGADRQDNHLLQLDRFVDFLPREGFIPILAHRAVAQRFRHAGRLLGVWLRAADHSMTSRQRPPRGRTV